MTLSSFATRNRGTHGSELKVLFFQDEYAPPRDAARTRYGA
jgi:hypothetical protein